ncbi:hypothetical protein [Moraxella cuniculi]|nr:hypothetical protein [Moraxella cuniculi]OOS05147.1 hypothetical protein B0189_07320 [Moraxella cuniculi]
MPTNAREFYDKAKLFATPAVSRYTYYTLSFQAGMAISLAAMPVYFKNENALAAYGMAYSAMAITGAFSFVYGMMVAKVHFSLALLFGSMLYALALALRIFTTPIVAVMTAVLAGVGASVALLAGRMWLLELTQNSQQNTTQLTAMRSILLSACTLFGTAFVALSVHAFGDVYFFLLLLAAMLVGIASIFAYKENQTDRGTLDNHQSINNKPQVSLRQLITLPVLLFAGSSLIGGIYTGLIKPYLILMFVDYGMAESGSIFVFLGTVFVAMLANFILLRYHHLIKQSAFAGFFVAMIALVLIYLGLSYVLSLQLGFVSLIIIVMLRSACLSLTASFEQVLQYDMLDASILAVALGLMQTAFLAGDAIGSLITSLWIIPKTAADYADLFRYSTVLIVIELLMILGIKIQSRQACAKVS